MNFKAVFKKIFTSRWFIFGAALLVVYSLVGFLLVPFVAAHYLKRYAKEQLAHELVLQKLRFNPFTWTMRAGGLALKAANQAPLMTVASFSANFDFFSSLYESAWTFSSIMISDPFLRVIVQKNGGSNLSELLRHRKAGGSQPAQQAGNQALPKILLEEVALQGGKINFTDRRESPPADVFLRSLNLDLEELTTLPDRTGGYDVSGRTKAGERLKWRGSVSLNPIRSEGSLKLEAVQAATVWEFLKDKISCNKPDGEATVTADYLFDLSGQQPQFTLNALDFDVSDLAVTLKGASSPMVTLKRRPDDREISNGISARLPLKPCALTAAGCAWQWIARVSPTGESSPAVKKKPPASSGRADRKAPANTPAIRKACWRVGRPRCRPSNWKISRST